MMHEQRLQLNIVLFQEGPNWVAQALEHDINAQGSRIEEAMNRFVAVLIGSIELDVEDGRLPLSSTPRAPQRYFDMFLEASRFELEIRQNVEGTVPQPWMISAMSRETRIYAR